MLGRIKGQIQKVRLRKIQKNEQERFQKMLAYVTKEQFGLEIGPSLRPCAPKREGYHVEIVDHLSKQELIDKYTSMGLDTSRIEDVDYIWDGRSYSEVTGKTGEYDYIIASHVIEHVPNVIGFLNDCSNMLKEDGILSLAVPDKRFTLDHFRMVTTTGKLINDYLSDEKCGSMGALTDYWNHVITRDGLTSWPRMQEKKIRREYSFIHDEEFNKKSYYESVDNKVFRDFHQNVFTPASFELLIYELWEYGLINLKIETLYDTTAEEFLVSMKKTNERPVMSERERMELIRRVSLENVVEI